MKQKSDNAPMNPPPVSLSGLKPTPSNSGTPLNPLRDEAEKAAVVESNDRDPVTVKYGFTGRLKIGKDFCAKEIGAAIHGFAEPLYAMCRHFFGTDNKDSEGMRQTMQTIGQWGWGAVNESYPLSTQRASFTLMVRGMGERLMDKGWRSGVDWSRYGLDKFLWVNAMLKRSEADPSPVQAVVNVRFNHEREPLVAHGFKLVHVMCSPLTYSERLKKAGMAPDSPALTDLSEMLAKQLDGQVLAEISRRPTGPKLMVVWSDPVVKRPSERIMSLDDFKAYTAKLKGEIS